MVLNSRHGTATSAVKALLYDLSSDKDRRSLVWCTLAVALKYALLSSVSLRERISCVEQVDANAATRQLSLQSSSLRGLAVVGFQDAAKFAPAPNRTFCLRNEALFQYRVVSANTPMWPKLIGIKGLAAMQALLLPWGLCALLGALRLGLCPSWFEGLATSPTWLPLVR